MKPSLNQNFEVGLILFCVIAVMALYVLNPYQITYQLTEWKEFGALPIEPKQILDFTPQTQAWVGYIEPDTKEMFTCKEAILYVETENGENYRCCNSPEKISCILSGLPNQFAEETCGQRMMEAKGIQYQLPQARDYKVFGHCPDSGDPTITVIQIASNGDILWKSINTLGLDILDVGLKCIIAPWLLVIAGWLTLVIVKASKTK
jgi:hypothetical protein